MNKDFSIDINTKQVSFTDESIVLEGWANKFTDEEGNIIKDRDGESVFALGIDISTYLKNPIILFQHDKKSPIGRAIEVKTAPEGLYIKCEIFKELHPVAYAAAKLGVVNSFSIGFKVLRDSYDPNRDIWLLTSTELYECSVVSIPANAHSQFSVAKSADGKSYMAMKTESQSQEVPVTVPVTTVVAPVTPPTLSITDIPIVIPITDTGVVTLAPTTLPTIVTEAPVVPVIETHFQSILTNVSPDTFEAVYSFYDKLGTALNTTINNAMRS